MIEIPVTVLWEFRGGQCDVTFVDQTNADFHSITVNENIALKYMTMIDDNPDAGPELIIEFLDAVEFVVKSKKIH